MHDLSIIIFLSSSRHSLFLKRLYDIINEIMQKCMFVFHGWKSDKKLEGLYAEYSCRKNESDLPN